MADFKIIELTEGAPFVSIYTETGIAPGTLVHIRASYIDGPNPILISAAAQPPNDAVGQPLRDGDQYDTEANDADIWVRCTGRATLNISEIPT